MSKIINGVFEGGGVKGIGLVGAVAMAENLGYKFQHLAGTSAGSIVAALLAAGYTGRELRDIISNLDYRKFKDKGVIDHIPVVGALISLEWEKGIYEGKYIEKWLRKMLKDKNIQYFGNLPEDRQLKVVVSDISTRQMVVFPDDAPKYGLDPKKMDIAHAVRMSMSIPLFYEPIKLQDSYMVDGGLLSNYPVWIFDQSKDEPAATIGFKLVDPDEGQPSPIHDGISLMKACMGTMLESFDKQYIKDAQFKRTIPIPTLGVNTTDFDLTPDRSDDLYNSGMNAALKFFADWDFQDFFYNYKAESSRTTQLKKASKPSTNTLQ